MKSYIEKETGTRFYLVDHEKDLLEKDFIYLYQFTTDTLKYISVNEFKNDFREIHILTSNEDLNPVIFKNSIKTPDGTILTSEYRHDYKEHKDRISGETYINDGGNEYLRRSSNTITAVDLSITELSPFCDKREACKWGSFGKEDKGPLVFIKVADMTNEHLKAVITTQHHMSKAYRDVMKEELLYRLKNSIIIED